MSTDGLKKTANLVFGPHLGIVLGARLGYVTRHRHPSSRIAVKLVYGDSVGERCSQHHADDLNAATGETTFCSKVFEPSRDVVSF